MPIRTALMMLVAVGFVMCPRTLYATGQEDASAGQPHLGRSVERLPMVDEWKARAVVVTAEDPSRVAAYAAKELMEHVEKATGALLPVATETDVPDGYPTRIYIGVTQAGQKQGIEAEALGGDAFVLRTVGNDIYIVGKEDKAADPLEHGKDLRPNPYGGTLFGVYELLHRYLGVRWLWPGELGTFVPRTDAIVIDRLDEVVAPKLKYRMFRWGWAQHQGRGGAYEPYIKRLAFSEEAVLQSYVRDMRIYERRHRMGFSEPVARGSHSFHFWWWTHGKEHPEWFATSEDGKREKWDEAKAAASGPSYNGHKTMCVSNPDLHKYIVEEAWDGGEWMNLGASDSGHFCHCPKCLSWDGPQEEEGARIVSDRYARFWNTVYDMAVKRNPDVKIAVLLYCNYLPAPRKIIKVNKNIYAQFCPWGHYQLWFPTSESRLDWARQQWVGWEKTGITLALRPNHTLTGYAMPQINTRQAGEFVRFAYQHGLMGVDFDALTGQWAVRGPENYMYYRLFVSPETPIAEIRKEYCSAFGPGAEYVERYFDYWEHYGHALREEGRWGNFYRDPRGIETRYPPEVFPPAKAILDDAMKAARRHPLPEFAERIKFLQAGLEHARLCVRFMASVSGTGGQSFEEGKVAREEFVADRERFQNAQQALNDLIRFRRANEHLYIAEYVNLSGGLENRWLMHEIDELMK